MIPKVAIALIVLLVGQAANVAIRQGSYRITCTDKQGKTSVFVIGRDFLSLDGSCVADNGARGTACRRLHEVVGAEGGLCVRQ